MGVLAWGFAALAATPDKNSCAAYIEFCALQSKAHTAQAHAREAGIPAAAKAYWEIEYRTLQAQIEALKPSLFEETEKIEGRQIVPGSTVQVLSANNEELPAFHSTRPANKPPGARVTRLSEDGERMLVVPARSSAMHLWDLSRNVFWTLSMDGRVLDAAFDTQDNLIALDDKGNLAVFTSDGRKFGVNLPEGQTQNFALSSGNLLRITEGRLLGHYPGKTGDRSFDLPSLEGAQFLRISSDSVLGAISFGSDVHIIDLRSGARLKSFPQFNNSELVSLEFVPDSHRLVGLGENGSLSLWDPQAIRVVTVFQLEHMDGRCLALDASGHAFIGGSQFGGIEGAVAIVDLNLGEEVGRYDPGHPGGVGTVALAFEGTALVTTASKSEEIHFHYNPLR